MITLKELMIEYCKKRDKSLLESFMIRIEKIPNPTHAELVNIFGHLMEQYGYMVASFEGGKIDI